MKFLLKTIILFLVFNSALAMEIRSIKKDKVFSKASYELNDTNIADIFELVNDVIDNELYLIQKYNLS